MKYLEQNNLRRSLLIVLFKLLAQKLVTEEEESLLSNLRLQKE